jgi:anti-sigma regulatory factor (Ser/Thr protein kinase)
MSVYQANPDGDGLLIYVPQRLPSTVVILDGRLTMAGVDRLRDSLLKCLVACPDSVVIDVANLVADDDLPLSVFRVVRRHAANWPAVPVVLAAPAPELAERLARMRIDVALPVYPTRAEAVVRAIGPPTIARLDWDLVSGPNAPAQARARITEMCQAWGVNQVLDAALIVASELVTNAVVHAANSVHASGVVHMTVLLRRMQLHLVVRDGNPDPPRRTQSKIQTMNGISLEDGGRGLPLLDAVCRAWGHLSNHNGKAVWAIVDVTEPGVDTEVLVEG